MQLNNKTDNTIIELGKVPNIQENKVFIKDIFIKMYNDDGTFAREFVRDSYFYVLQNTNFSNDFWNNISIDTNYIYNSLTYESNFISYVPESNKQNWLYDTKLYRVVIKVEEHLNYQNTDPIYKALVRVLEDRHAGYIATTKDFIILYVDTLMQEELSQLPEGALNNWIFTEKQLS